MISVSEKLLETAQCISIMNVIIIIFGTFPDLFFSSRTVQQHLDII
jgi:hypothetical protein